MAAARNFRSWGSAPKNEISREIKSDIESAEKAEAKLRASGQTRLADRMKEVASQYRGELSDLDRVDRNRD